MCLYIIYIGIYKCAPSADHVLTLCSTVYHKKIFKYFNTSKPMFVFMYICMSCFTYSSAQRLAHCHIGVIIAMLIRDMLECAALDQINTGHIRDIPHAAEIKTSNHTLLYKLQQKKT